MELREIVMKVISIMFVASLFAIAASVVIGFNNALNEETERDNAINLNKTKWFKLNNCVHDGYVAGRREPEKLYRCGDKVLIWRDIPTE